MGTIKFKGVRFRTDLVHALQAIDVLAFNGLEKFSEFKEAWNDCN